MRCSPFGILIEYGKRDGAGVDVETLAQQAVSCHQHDEGGGDKRHREDQQHLLTPAPKVDVVDGANQCDEDGKYRKIGPGRDVAGSLNGQPKASLCDPSPIFGSNCRQGPVRSCYLLVEVPNRKFESCGSNIGGFHQVDVAQVVGQDRFRAAQANRTLAGWQKHLGSTVEKQQVSATGGPE